LNFGSASYFARDRLPVTFCSYTFFGDANRTMEGHSFNEEAEKQEDSERQHY
jgi:hypothetical protein